MQLDFQAEPYLGVLDSHDPLHAFLVKDVLQSELGLRVEDAIFDMNALHKDMLMVLYSERQSGVRLACKFYARKLPVDQEPGPDYFRQRLHEEYQQMVRVRALGFDRPPYRVVRPLALNEALEYILVQEYVEAPNLDHFFRLAYQSGDAAPLQARLPELGCFLGLLHDRSQDEVRWEGSLSELQARLDELDVAGAEQRQELERLQERWREVAAELVAPQVLLHGDCTPTNFLFPSESEVVAIDLERSRRGDPMGDLGSLQAELVHAGLHFAGNCEPSLRAAQGLREGYARARAESDGAASRLRFWTGIYLLRMSRNDWLEPDYRRRLVEEAILWLKR